jgi:hypothetical protein
LVAGGEIESLGCLLMRQVPSPDGCTRNVAPFFIS